MNPVFRLLSFSFSNYSQCCHTAMSSFPQNPKFQEPVTLDFLDAELENDIKVEVEYSDACKYPCYIYIYTYMYIHIHICMCNSILCYPVSNGLNMEAATWIVMLCNKTFYFTSRYLTGDRMRPHAQAHSPRLGPYFSL